MKRTGGSRCGSCERIRYDGEVRDGALVVLVSQTLMTLFGRATSSRAVRVSNARYMLEVLVVRWDGVYEVRRAGLFETDPNQETEHLA